jgi:hypothetical protein
MRKDSPMVSKAEISIVKYKETEKVVEVDKHNETNHGAIKKSQKKDINDIGSYTSFILPRQCFLVCSSRCKI